MESKFHQGVRSGLTPMTGFAYQQKGGVTRVILSDKRFLPEWVGFSVRDMTRPVFHRCSYIEDYDLGVLLHVLEDILRRQISKSAWMTK